MKQSFRINSKRKMMIKSMIISLCVSSIVLANPVFAQEQSSPPPLPGANITAPIVIDAVAFGADPSGKSDCATVLTQALEKLHANGGGVLRLPAGRYKLDLPRDGRKHLLRLYSNTSIIGDGWRTILDTRSITAGASSLSAILFAGEDNGEELRNIQIVGISLQGAGIEPKFERTPVAGILLSNASGFEVRDCRFDNIIGISICYANVKDGIISGNNINNGQRDGISGFGTIQNLRITGNNIVNGQDDAIAINFLVPNTKDGAEYRKLDVVKNVSRNRMPKNIIIANNVISGSTSRGINILNSSDIVINGNTIENTRMAGIRVSHDVIAETCHSQNILITGNIIKNAYRGSAEWALSLCGMGDGILLEQADAVVIADNIIQDCARHAIGLRDDVKDCIVRGNLIKNASYGIWISSNSSILEESGNNFRDILNEKIRKAPPAEDILIQPTKNDPHKWELHQIVPGLKSNTTPAL